MIVDNAQQLRDGVRKVYSAAAKSPQDKYPFSEVFCGRAPNDNELTGNYYEDR